MVKIKTSAELKNEIVAEMVRKNQRNIDLMQAKIVDAIKDGKREASFIIETNTKSKIDFDAVNLIEDNGLDDVRDMFAKAGYTVSNEEQFFAREDDVHDRYMKLVIRW